MDLFKAVLNKNLRPSTRDEIIAIYKEQYPGVKILKNGKELESWKRPLAEALQPFTMDKNGNPIKIDNIMRRFQARKGKTLASTPSKAQQEEYRKLGRTLPLQGGYIIRGFIYIKYSPTKGSESCVKRRINEVLTGEWAEALEQAAYQAQSAEDLAALQVISDKYNESPSPDQPGDGLASGDCKPPELTVEAIDAEDITDNPDDFEFDDDEEYE